MPLCHFVFEIMKLLNTFVFLVLILLGAFSFLVSQFHGKESTAVLSCYGKYFSRHKLRKKISVNRYLLLRIFFLQEQRIFQSGQDSLIGQPITAKDLVRHLARSRSQPCNKITKPNSDKTRRRPPILNNQNNVFRQSLINR